LRDRPITSRARRMLPNRLQDEVVELIEYLRTRGLEKPEMRTETRRDRPLLWAAALTASLAAGSLVWVWLLARLRYRRRGSPR
jgi:hypothetical protein